ncbi:adaptor complex subunit medium chain 3 [Dioszegia hungarica]|uniref:Adaptor complex subunit medium chain 3 n=1 Tax=Dioszegia hungarica TaxID=4972 RepID=A0AA38HF81_9TREE|nr:adaptor complex subunit medium chain 3 [Dioszegia hungarica]KAI9637856.1 adaptor complex subunit medium chain 3 [Dioszegia hungarica]
MTRIDGIIILDTNGKPLISSHFPQHPPSYATSHIDTFNHALKVAQASPSTSSSTKAELEPILWVNALSRGAAGVGMGGAGLCHVEREGLRFLVPVGRELNPLFAFAFLDSFLETLTEYLGEVTEASIKENFDIVYMLIEEMLDEGHPMTMETNMLKEIVLPPTLMRKLLSAAGVSSIQSPASAPFTAPIPWRKPNVRHSNNEIYFDVEESLDAIIDRKGNLLSSSITGRINCNSRLSGNPDLLLNFGNAKVMTDCGFHPCIRYNRWERDHVLSFIPPDGKFRLLEYQTDTSIGRAQLPLQLKASMSIEDYGGKFSLTLTSRTNARPIEDIVISIHLGQGTSSVSATATGDKRMPGVNSGGLARREENAAEGGVGGGTWEFDPHTQVLRWRLASLTATERAPSLTGSFTSTAQHPVPSPSFDLAFLIQHQTFSGLRIDQLKVAGDVMYKPFKGVKVASKAGRYEVRW